MGAIKSITANEEEDDSRMQAFKQLFIDDNQHFELSIISGGHRKAALTLCEKERCNLPEKVMVRVLSFLDAGTFHFLSKTCNDNNECHAKQLVVDKINQVLHFVQWRRQVAAGKQETQADLYKV
jgi:hypothetical protein